MLEAHTELATTAAEEIVAGRATAAARGVIE
jgi:hypothetical protein